MSLTRITSILVVLLLSLSTTFAQLMNPKIFRLPHVIRGMSNYSWKIYLMTDGGLYYWYQKIPDMDKGGFVCSSLGNHMFLVTEDGDLLKFNANEFEQEDKFNVKLKEEKFLKLFYEGQGQELYGVTNKGRVFLIQPGSRKEILKPVHKGFGGNKVIWSNNLSTFLTSKGKLLQYIRFNGKAPSAPVAVDRNITALQVDDSRFEILIGLDNGKVTALEQDLKTKKWTETLSTLPITSVQWHPLDHYLFAGDAGGRIHIMDMKKKKILFTKKAHNGAIDLRVLKNATNGLDLVTIAADNDIKFWPINDLPPDYHRIVRGIMEYRQVRYLKKGPQESDKSFESRTSPESLGKYLYEQRNQVIDSLAMTLRVTDKVALIPRGDSVRLELMPFKPVTFYGGSKLGPLTGARVDSLRYGLRDDNDFEIRKFKLVTASDKTVDFDISSPPVMEKTFVPLELAREVAQEELTIKDQLSKIVESLRQKGELNNVELSMDAALKVDRDSLGRDELNLHVTYLYRGKKVDVAGENADYPSGKYRLSDSKAGTLMVDFMLRSAQQQLQKHIQPNHRVTFRLTGSTDKTKVSSKLPYSNEFGTFDDYPYFFQGQLAGLNLTPDGGITQNSQLGFLRTYSVRKYVESQSSIFNSTKNKFVHFSEEADGYGPEFRKVKIEIILHDINNANADE